MDATRKKWGRRGALLLLAVLVIAACAVASRRPGGHEVTRPKDVRSAKAAGDALLASRDTTVVVFTAHPDDAEWWVGGTLGMLARYNKVILVLGTSGDAGNGGMQPDLGDLREKLQVEGAAINGYADVVFLRHPDGHLAEADGYPEEVAELLVRYAPETVITFDTEHEAGGYHHDDHAAAGRAALAAVRTRGGSDLYLFHTGAPDTIVDYGPSKDAKLKALSVLASYHDTSALAWLAKFARQIGLEHAAITYGSRASFPEVGVEYGELLRKDRSTP